MNEGGWQVRAWAPGRTEIAGNHTDHQGGRVVSAAISRCMRILLRKAYGDIARVESEGYEPFEIELGDMSPQIAERNKTAALVRGVANGLRAAGVGVRGFKVQVISTLPSGGGMSSSAAFELALARGLALLFGEEEPDGHPAQPRAAQRKAASAQRPAGKQASRLWMEPTAGLDASALVDIAVETERRYFGKSCGFQDQTAIAYGGICDMDFSDLQHPRVTPIDFDFAAHGLRIALVDTRSDHSAHTADFERLVTDMETVASYFGEEVLGRVDPESFFGSLGEACRVLPDSAVLRAWHYFTEMELVDRRARAMREGDVAAFLQATRESGESSAEYLQNVSISGSADQPAMVTLAACRRALAGQGAARIHGGGFGGTVQAYVPTERAEAFVSQVEALLGEGVCSFVEPVAEGAWAQWIV